MRGWATRCGHPTSCGRTRATARHSGVPREGRGAGVLPSPYSFIAPSVMPRNDYLWQLVVLSRDNLRTLQIGIASLQTETVPNLAFKVAW